MTWALVYMLCNPTCIVEYVVEYPTRAACARDMSQHNRRDNYTLKCVPISKD